MRLQTLGKTGPTCDNPPMTNETGIVSFLDSGKKALGWFSSLGTAERIAFDLEADGLYSYEDKICLAQVACAGKTAILDPLADRETIAPLASLLRDPSVEKVAHGADYDVRLLKKTLGFGPVNLFDTMIAAQLLGYEKVGLAALVELHFGVEMDKKHQRADWTKRPLTQSMIDYAALDVAHLLELCDILKAGLADKGRTVWAEEEFRLLEAAPSPTPRKPWCLDVKGSHKLSPRQLGVLQALLDLREATAKKRDRPPFKILPNQTLIAWAQNPPRVRRDVTEAEGVNRISMERMATQILEAVEMATALPEEGLPQRPASKSRPPMTPVELKKLEKLKEARNTAAKELGIDPGLLVNTATLEKFARASEDEAPALVKTELKNWQKEAVGGAVVTALAG